MCSGCEACCAFCLISEECSLRCCFSGSVFVSS